MMYQRFTERTWTIVLVALAVVAFVGCGGDDDDQQTQESGFGNTNPMLSNSIVDAYADSSVVPTYKQLDDEAADLQDAVDAFSNDPTSDNLETVREEWEEARVPWESSEAFLFGPVASNGYDPALDSWPVDRTQLQNVLDSDQQITQDYVSNLDAGQKGFHTIEWLLYGEGGSKKPGDFTDREFDYLTATTAELKTITNDLETSWTEGVEGNEAYGETFRTAGEDGNQKYPSVQSAGLEIVDGLVTIVNEVGTGKISDPFKQRDTSLVESQFSYNSLTDFASNIRGAKMAYLGDSVSETDGKGLSDWVAKVDSDLDQRIRNEFDAAINAIDAIPEPFRDAIQNSDGRKKIQTAMDKLSTLQSTLKEDLRPRVAGEN